MKEGFKYKELLLRGLKWIIVLSTLLIAVIFLQVLRWPNFIQDIRAKKEIRNKIQEIGGPEILYLKTSELLKIAPVGFTWPSYQIISDGQHFVRKAGETNSIVSELESLGVSQLSVFQNPNAVVVRLRFAGGKRSTRGLRFFNYFIECWHLGATNKIVTPKGYKKLAPNVFEVSGRY